MPLTNFHAARVINPDEFQQDSFRTKEITKGVEIIVGKLTNGDGSMIAQAYHFDKDVFTPEEAKAWLKKNDVKYTEFAPAAEQNSLDEEIIIPNREIRTIPNEDSQVRMMPDSRKVEGRGIVFNKESQDLGGFTEVVLPQAIEGVLERSDIFALLNHNKDKGVLARSTNGAGSLKLEPDQNGVNYSFEAPNYDLGNELIEGIKRGDIRGSSFAFNVSKDGAKLEKRSDGSYLRTITKFEGIYDMSPCYQEAYLDTAVALRNLDEFKNMKVEDLIPEAGTNPITDEPVIAAIAETKEEKRDLSKENNNHLKTNKMTVEELKDKRAQALEQNDKIFDAKTAENRTMTEKEEAQTAANNQLVRELDLQIETETRKLGKGVIVGPYIKFAKEQEPFSLIKAIRAKVQQKEMPNAARDVYVRGLQDFRDSGINPTGDIIIPNVGRTEKRAESPNGLEAGIQYYGQEIVAEDKKAILPPLVDKLVFGGMATYMTGLVGNVSIPSYAGTTVDWKEEVEAAADGRGVFSEVNFSPKRLTGYIDVSKQFLLQDGVGAERLLMSNIANAVARKLESTILGVAVGSSSKPQGMGYYITTGTDTKAASVTATYALIVAMESAIDSANASVGNLAYITNANCRGTLKSIDKGVSNDTGDMICSEDNVVNGYPLLVTNACSAIAGSGGTGDLLLFGNWADLCIGQWGGYDITVDPYSKAHTAQVRITINAYFDAKGLRGTVATDVHGSVTTAAWDYATSFTSLAIT